MVITKKAKRVKRKKVTWAMRLDAAVKRKAFTKLDMSLAHNFLTCAVGELTGNDFSHFRDQQLNQFGYLFLEAVEKNAIGNANYIYGQIREHVTAMKDSQL